MDIKSCHSDLKVRPRSDYSHNPLCPGFFCESEISKYVKYQILYLSGRSHVIGCEASEPERLIMQSFMFSSAIPFQMSAIDRDVMLSEHFPANTKHWNSIYTTTAERL